MEHARSIRARWLVALTASSGATFFLWFLGITPWPAVLTTLLSLLLVLGQFMSWPAAAGAAVITLLFVATVALRTTPALGLSLDVSAGVLLLFLSAVAILVLIRTRGVKLPERGQLIGGFAAVGGLVTFIVVMLGRAAGSDDYEWMMHNDAVWNSVTARFVIADGGLDASQHPNSAPLTALLMAAAASVGRGELDASSLLGHDVARFAAFMLFMCAASCVLAGLIGFVSTRGASLRARWLAAILVGVLPSTWFIFGVASELGFFNATVVVVLLCASWLLWLDRSHLLLPNGLLVLAAVCLLATWAPLAIIPLGLAASNAIDTIREAIRKGAGWLRAGAVLLIFTPLGLYGLFVTLPDLGRDGAALAVDGAFIAFTPLHLAIIAIITLVTMRLVSVRKRDTRALIGTAIVLSGGFAALAYLVFQRRDAASLWGYYPAKFAWFLATLLLILLAAEIASAMVIVHGSRVRSGIAAVCALAVPIALMAMIPPQHGWRSAVTPLAITMKIGAAGESDVARELLQIAVDGEPALVVNYGDEPTDLFLNGWLLQIEAETAQDPIRDFSYFYIPGNETQACEALIVWEREVRVVTSDAGLESRLGKDCGDASFRVELRPNPDAG